MYSCGDDGLLLRHDLSRGLEFEAGVDGALNMRRNQNARKYQPLDSIEAHDEMAALKLSVHPEIDSIVLTSGQDGSITLWDFRSKTAEVGRIDSANSQKLRDLRMSFKSSGPFQGYDLNLLEFHTTLSPLYSTSVANPVDTSSVSFSPCGTLFGATFQKWYPTIYSIHDPFPLATLRSKVDGIRFRGPSVGQPMMAALQRPVRGYLSTCTIKTGAFGGGGDVDFLGKQRGKSSWKRNPGGLVFSVGSDDRRAYVWEVPNKEFLVSKRVDVDPARDFGGSGGLDKRQAAIAFVGDKGEKKVPYEVEEEAFSVGEHRSIVNSVLFHPSLPLIVTAGVEKIVRVFSPFPFSNYNETLENKSDTVPRLNALPLLTGMFDDFEATTREDTWTLADFDRLIIRESNRNTLWNNLDDLSSDTSDGDDDSSDSDDSDDSNGSSDSWETMSEDVNEEEVSSNRSPHFISLEEVESDSEQELEDAFTNTEELLHGKRKRGNSD
ncbi:UNVERIFIED_CONTAM: hypothetical protein HDU68_008149 [Siphonaria sp. JEL0065]|nr:hypothetical protein HDU68_008149 [Siphonaria sp. JEL0065]